MGHDAVPPVTKIGYPSRKSNRPRKSQNPHLARSGRSKRKAAIIDHRPRRQHIVNEHDDFTA